MKLARHEKIIELIRQYDIDTQEELAARLNQAGFKVTQATVSRDIRALKLTKVTVKDGKSRYAILDHGSSELGDKYCQSAERCSELHGYWTKSGSGKDSYRYGHGCGYSAGCIEMAGDPWVYSRR